MRMIVPTILTDDINEAQVKLRKINGLVDEIHLDIMDGCFVDNKTLSLEDYREVRKDLSSFRIGAHLMVEEPLDCLKTALNIGVELVIAHVEVLDSQLDFVENCTKLGMDSGLAIDLDTSLSELEKGLLESLDTVLIMLVKAGWGGQKYEKEKLKEVRELEKIKKDKGFKFRICVDGGVNEDTIKECVRAGAEVLSVGSVVWKAENSKKAIDKLNRLVNNDRL